MSRAALAIIVSLAACSSPPDVTVVDPSEGPAGSMVRIEGTGFQPTVSVGLRAEGSADTALSVQTIKPTALTVKVPDALEAGAYTLVVAQGGNEVLVPSGFTVAAPVQDQPCGNLYTANTQVSPITEQVVIDRFYTKDDKRETVRVGLDKVKRVAFEKVAVDKGLCSVIYLDTADGKRLRFADAIESGDAKKGLDLKARAYKLGQEIGKPVDVTREDAPPAADTDASGESAGG